MIQKSAIGVLLAIISTAGWVVTQQVQSVWQSNPPKIQPNLDESLVESLVESRRESRPGGRRGMWREEAVQYGWRLEYHEALEEAHEADKPLMIVFRCVP